MGMNWRPIKTAPMDGRKILVWDAQKSSVYTIRSDDLKQRRVFHWMEGFTHWAPIEPPGRDVRQGEVA